MFVFVVGHTISSPNLLLLPDFSRGSTESSSNWKIREDRLQALDVAQLAPNSMMLHRCGVPFFCEIYAMRFVTCFSI